MTEELKPLPCPFDEWFDTRYPPEHGSVTAANVRRMFHEVCREAWDAALTRSPAWRDIESAPRDGSDIIAYSDRFGVIRVRWGKRFTGDEYWWVVPPYTNPSPTAARPISVPGEVTHWMPLPLPPEEGRG